ncbi:MAG: hypothetical protein ABIO72_03445 [Patescibacteria group bacterium]
MNRETLPEEPLTVSYEMRGLSGDRGYDLQSSPRVWAPGSDGDQAALARELSPGYTVRQLEADAEWAARNRRELQAMGRRLLAIRDGRVVARATAMPDLETQLGSNGLTIEGVFVATFRAPIGG